MKHKVEALDTYVKLNVKDNQLDRIVPEGHQFEVDDDRLKTLLGDNPFKKAFVKLVGKASEMVEKEENAIESAKEIIENEVEEIKEEVKPNKKKKNK